MKEYFCDILDEEPEKLECRPLPFEDYKKAHQGTVILCHDVFILYNDGILLVKRKSQPEEGVFWPVGGRVKRGIKIEESLKIKTLEECNLELKKISFLGFARTMFGEDPFGHGNGTDTMNFAYLAEGVGEIKLNDLHEEYIIVKRENYTPIFSQNLHPYVNDYIERIFSKKDCLTINK